MTDSTISEATFLLSELHYTLAQLDVQLAMRQTEQSDEGVAAQRIHQIVARMQEDEHAFQSRYAALLAVDLPADPVIAPGDEAATFSILRGLTLNMFGTGGSAPEGQLVELMREQVALDRKHMTEIADQRAGVLQRDDDTRGAL
ncbi:MAG: hypothetical protein PVSMB7_12110 [Chloroflexota bacterium]